MVRNISKTALTNFQARAEAVLRFTRSPGAARVRPTLFPALGRQRLPDVGQGAAGPRGKRFQNNAGLEQ